MNISEETLNRWSKGPGLTESTRCENAERIVREAVLGDAELAKLKIDVFTQGSYRARTHVGGDSDVDICVRCRNTYLLYLPDGTTLETFGLGPASLQYRDFKNELERALRARFGPLGVNRGTKAFDVHENSYRVDADVVPAFEYRHYNINGKFDEGVAFIPDNGGSKIFNYPNQTEINGIARNTATGRKYKRCIRILKSLRNDMQGGGVAAAKNIASFLIECLVWNADVAAFEKEDYTAMIRYLLIDLWNKTKPESDCSKWLEVNNLKCLFDLSQPWTKAQAHAFLLAAWQHMGYKS